MKKFILSALLVLTSPLSFAKCNGEFSNYINMVHVHTNVAILLNDLPGIVKIKQPKIENFDLLHRGNSRLESDSYGILESDVNFYISILDTTSEQMKEVDDMATNYFNELSACVKKELSPKCTETLTGLKSELTSKVFDINYGHIRDFTQITSLLSEYSRDLNQSIHNRTVVPQPKDLLNSTRTYLGRANRLEEIKKAIGMLDYSMPINIALNCE